MAEGADGVSREPEPQVARLGGGATLAFLVGIGAAVAAGVALWANEGAEIFLAQAFSALAACF